MSDEKRNEGQLLTDIIGMESLVDEITYKLADDAPDMPTATAILGPFWRKDAPLRKMGMIVCEHIQLMTCTDSNQATPSSSALRMATIRSCTARY